MNIYVKSIDTNDEVDVIDYQRVHVAFVDPDEEDDPDRPEIVVSFSMPKNDNLTLQQLKAETIEIARSRFLRAASRIRP